MHLVLYAVCGGLSFRTTSYSLVEVCWYPLPVLEKGFDKSDTHNLRCQPGIPSDDLLWGVLRAVQVASRVVDACPDRTLIGDPKIHQDL